MSSFLDEISDGDLEAELARRRRARLDGRCDYCDGDATSVPCKHAERHELPWKGASLVLPDLPCTACAPNPDASCATCRGTGKVFDGLAVIFQTNLVAIFGERTSELSPNLLARLRDLWNAGRRGAERSDTKRIQDPLHFNLVKARAPRDGEPVFSLEDIRRAVTSFNEATSSGSFWFDENAQGTVAKIVTPQLDKFLVSGLAVHDSDSKPASFTPFVDSILGRTSVGGTRPIPREWKISDVVALEPSGE